MENLTKTSKLVKTYGKNENTVFIKSPKNLNPTIRLVCILILSLSLTGLFTSFLAVFGIISHPLLSGQFGHWFLLNLGPIIFLSVIGWIIKTKLHTAVIIYKATSVLFRIRIAGSFQVTIDTCFDNL